MFKGIGDKLSCLVRQTPQSGSNYPPHRSNLLYSQSNIIKLQLQTIH